MTALLASGLHKSFGSVQALQGLDLAVPRGSFFGLLGPNGAGKSTLMSIVSGFLQADSGRVELLGEPLDPHSAAQKRQLGLAPQHIALYRELSAEANLFLFGRLCGLRGKPLHGAVDQALQLARLEDRRTSLVKEYSGGMMRRLNIAAALLHKPAILLCDEPTVGVDPQSRNAIFDTLLELKRNGTTVIFSTHYMEEAERLCDQIGIIDRGRILRIGDLDSLLDELPGISAITIRTAAWSEPLREGLERFGQLDLHGQQAQLKPHGEFLLSDFYRWVEQNGQEPRDFQVERPSLENLFLQLTGRELRE